MGDDVELCLEVQVDPESKKILSNPEKCRSALLDVTVVKPKEIEAFGTQITNTLRAEEVRKLISSMEKQRRKKQKVLDKLKEDDTVIKIRKHENAFNSQRMRKQYSKFSPKIDDLERKDFIGIVESVEPLFCEIRRSLRNVETRITNMKDINLIISETTVDEAASQEFLFKRRKSARRISKHLQNSTILQADIPKDLKSILLCKNKEKCRGDTGEEVSGRCFCENCGIIGLLSECQRHPLIEELHQSGPPSEYKSEKKKTRFNVDSEMKSYNDATYIDHLSKRVKLLEERLAAQEERVVPKEYFKKVITKVVDSVSPKAMKSRSEILKKESKHCCNHAKTKDGKNHKYIKTTDQSTSTDDDLFCNGYIWRWGEEILKPGIDLKNRIVNLLQDIISKISLNEKAEAKEREEAEKVESFHVDPFKEFMKHVNAKVYDTQTVLTEFRKNGNETKKVLLKENGSSNKNVDVSYVNPKLWRKESPVPNDESKREFLKIVLKAKPQQKEVLWRNIWNQAIANGQTKDDKITIKIPCQNKESNEEQKLFETEIKIGEVEQLLKD